MNKRVWILIVLLLGAMNGFAQRGFLPSRFNGKAAMKDGVAWGIKAGVNSPRLYYTNPNLKGLPHDLVVSPSAGLFVEIPFLSMFSVAPEVNYQQRGGATSYLYEQNYHVNYKLLASYVSLRVPFHIYIPVSSSFKPYVFIGPDAGMVLMGKAKLSQPGLDIAESSTSLNSSNINKYYVGALVGAGIQMRWALSSNILVMKLDAALNWGLMDTFSAAEHAETAVSTNVHAYNLQGSRNSRGLEIHVSFGLIQGEKDACYSFESGRRR